MAATTGTTILLAEDDEITRRVMHAALLEMGFVVQLARDGDEGCALVDQLPEDCPAILITDSDMPGCCGEELAEYARRRYPEIKIIFISGTAPTSLLRMIAADPHARFLGKPFLPDDLRACLQTLGAA